MTTEVGREEVPINTENPCGRMIFLCAEAVPTQSIFFVSLVFQLNRCLSFPLSGSCTWDFSTRSLLPLTGNSESLPQEDLFLGWLIEKVTQFPPFLPPKYIHQWSQGKHSKAGKRKCCILRLKKTGSLNGCCSNIVQKMRNPVSMWEPI